MGAGIPNTNWTAKMVGKVTKKLEAAQGDAGYSGEISVRLDKYRPKHPERLPSKLLPQSAGADTLRFVRLFILLCNACRSRWTNSC